MAGRQPCRDYIRLLSHLRAVRISQAASESWNSGDAPDSRDGRNGHRRDSLQPAGATVESLAFSETAASRGTPCFKRGGVSFAAPAWHRRQCGRIVADRRGVLASFAIL